MSGLVVEHGAWRAAVLPEAGGLIARLDHGGLPVLRPMAEGAAGPLAAACFPMVPWCNRIAAGRFLWEGAAIRLPANVPSEPHAIHGHGWQSAWSIVSQSATACTIAHRHDGAAPGWPWAYEARQTVALTQAGCTLTLALTNQSDRVMPAGIGLHPYLRRRPESRAAFRAGPVIAVGADMIPTGARLPPGQFGDFAAEGGAALSGGLIDHCFTGWDGTAVVTDDCGAITLTAEGAAALHIYAPADADILCLEPVNHLPDAANSHAMPRAAPGETVSLTLRIGIAQPGQQAG